MSPQTPAARAIQMLKKGWLKPLSSVGKYGPLGS